MTQPHHAALELVEFLQTPVQENSSRFSSSSHTREWNTRAELMTAREVAELLSVPISTAREWGRNGTLPRVKLGRHVRYIRRHVEAAILAAEQR